MAIRLGMILLLVASLAVAEGESPAKPIRVRFLCRYGEVVSPYFAHRCAEQAEERGSRAIHAEPGASFEPEVDDALPSHVEVLERILGYRYVVIVLTNPVIVQHYQWVSESLASRTGRAQLIREALAEGRDDIARTLRSPDLVVPRVLSMAEASEKGNFAPLLDRIERDECAARLAQPSS